MYLNKDERDHIVRELMTELHARLDGGRKNLIVETCPYCGHGGGKFGIYVGEETLRKKPFMSHCFHCGHSTTTLEQLCEDIGRADLIPTETFDLTSGQQLDDFTFMDDDSDDIDDSLVVVEMPDDYKRTHYHRYFKKRGFTEDDYDFFPCGTTRGLNFKFNDYMIFPIIDSGDIVGYIARHKWSKTKIDDYNRKAKHTGKYQILRYRNSTENDFVKLLYNYDAVKDGKTDTVIIVEGVFDVVALTRKLNLYDNQSIAVVATFGKKISDTQIYKLQNKGVNTIVIGYDGDAVEAIKRTGEQLNEFFDVYVADIQDPSQDFDSMDFWDIYDAFAYNLKTITEYKLNKIQL